MFQFDSLKLKITSAEIIKSSKLFIIKLANNHYHFLKTMVNQASKQNIKTQKNKLK